MSQDHQVDYNKQREMFEKILIKQPDRSPCPNVVNTAVFILFCLLFLFCLYAHASQDLPSFDFADKNAANQWTAFHDISRISVSVQGMSIEIKGGDPYIHGPARDYPAGQMLWLNIRLKSDEAGQGQIFYFTDSKAANEEDSVRFGVPAARWVTIRIPFPSLGPKTYLRIDPPGTGGRCIIKSITFAPRSFYPQPEWPKPDLRALDGKIFTIGSNDLSFRHSAAVFSTFDLVVGGKSMAIGSSNQLIGYIQQGKIRWMNIADQPNQKVAKSDNRISGIVNFTDPDGGQWAIRQTFAWNQKSGVIDVETKIDISREREIIYLPLCVLFPGAGSFGQMKSQALFAGLEYLDAPDKSSSEADIVGIGSKRQVPDTAKITFPLMVIQADNRYVGLIWDKNPQYSAVFDSPDRLFLSGGHLVGVIFPGSDDLLRDEGNLLPYQAVELPHIKHLIFTAQIIGGSGKSVVPAIEKYVQLRGLPQTPRINRQRYIVDSAHGWLDSKVGESGLYRHAYWPGNTSFQPRPAADAAVYMQWLAVSTNDQVLSQKLKAAVKAAIAQVNPAEYNDSNIAHIGFPVAALVFGHIEENAARASDNGRKLLSRFEADGSVRYRQLSGSADLGKTHYSHDANGLTSDSVIKVLEYGTFSGDSVLILAGIRLLHALDKFYNTVPRGAQTWEIPLHAPDILAAAHLVRAYTIGYELTGDKSLLERARYWAWSGVPFVYLVNSPSGGIGSYSTIAVLGATGWNIVNWMGLPVQWCGLVYADALYRLLRYDPSNAVIWKQLADGITWSAIGQIFSRDNILEIQGLLPDSFNLKDQLGNSVAINPGTVQSDAIRLIGGPELYDFRFIRKLGLFIHAPGAITNVEEGGELAVSFVVKGWPTEPYYLLVGGLKRRPAVTINGSADCAPNSQYYNEIAGRLVLKVTGTPRISISIK